MSNHIDPKVKVQEIRDRRAAATEGPWNLEGKEIWRRGDGYGGEYFEGHVWITDFTGLNANNAVLIANAPADIDFLLSEYKRITEALEKIRDYDVSEEYNHVDEWAEAGAFGEVQKIAADALSHLKG